MSIPDLAQLTEAVKTGKRKDAKTITEEALAAKAPPRDILEALKVGMDDVGRRFKANEIFVPEVLVAARAMKTSMELLEPVLAASGIKAQYRVVIGTVEGDLHDITRDKFGMFDLNKLPSGEQHKRYHSTTRTAMNEAERAAFTDRALALWSRWCGVDVATLRREAEAA
jgi:hypothetical protein